MTNFLSDTVAERVRSIRKARGWSRDQLAAECAGLGMSALTHAALTNIESGRRNNGLRRRMITVDEVDVLAKAFCVPLHEFLGSEPSRWRERALRAEAKLRTIAAVATEVES